MNGGNFHVGKVMREYYCSLLSPVIGEDGGDEAGFEMICEVGGGCVLLEVEEATDETGEEDAVVDDVDGVSGE